MASSKGILDTLKKKSVISTSKQPPEDKKETEKTTLEGAAALRSYLRRK
jgi:hypothetical protein